jgi:hypothetical protein
MMYGDNGVLVDFEEMGKVIASSDIFVLGFVHFPERLLIDARFDQREAPLIQVVEPAGSAPERLTWLHRRRPSLSQPQTLAFLGWPHSPDFLVESGVWDRIRDRVGADSQDDVRAECDLALRQIQNLQLSATQAFLKGEDCATLWPRPEVPEARK